MVKKAIVEFLLVPESLDKTSDEIEAEMLKVFRKDFLIVPWSASVERIRIVDK